VLRCCQDPSLTPLPALAPLQILYQQQMGDDIMALIASIPRTMRTLQWAVQAGIGYKRLLSGLDPNLNPDAYAVQLSRLHDFWAQVRMLPALCAGVDRSMFDDAHACLHIFAEVPHARSCGNTEGTFAVWARGIVMAARAAPSPSSTPVFHNVLHFICTPADHVLD
jgi:hypothetical protein